MRPNAELTNLKNSLLSCMAASDPAVTGAKRRDVRKSRGLSKEDALDDIQEDIKTMVQSPLNWIVAPDQTAAGPTRRLHAELQRLLESKGALEQESLDHLQELVSSTVRSLDPNFVCME